MIAGGNSRYAAGVTSRDSTVELTLASPAHFRVMFRPELASPDEHPRVWEASSAIFDQLVGTISECQEQEAGHLPPGDPLPYVLTCWSAVHGLVSLWLDGPLALDPKGFGESAEKLAGMVLTTTTGLAGRPLGAAAPRARKKAAKARPKIAC